MTEEEKLRIQEEEKIRDEARRAIKKNASFSRKIWDFLNSPFAIWFLSSIVIGLAVWGYTKWEQSKTVKQQHKILLQNLHHEILIRMGQLEQATGKLVEEYDSQNPITYTISYLDRAESIINKTPRNYSDLISVYPEFENRNLLSLLTRFREVMPDSSFHINESYSLLSHIANDSAELSIALRQHGRDYMKKNYSLDERIQGIYTSMMDAYTFSLEMRYFLENPMEK